MKPFQDPRNIEHFFQVCPRSARPTPNPVLCLNMMARGSSPAVVAGRQVKRPNYVLPWNSGSMLPDYKMGAIKRVMITHPNF